MYQNTLNDIVDYSVILIVNSLRPHPSKNIFEYYYAKLLHCWLHRPVTMNPYIFIHSSILPGDLLIQ